MHLSLPAHVSDLLPEEVKRGLIILRVPSKLPAKINKLLPVQP